MENTQTGTMESSIAIEDKKEVLQRRTQKGFSLTLTGALVLLAGCASTMVMSSSDPMYNYFLYIPTSLGATMVIYGFYCIFE